MVLLQCTETVEGINNKEQMRNTKTIIATALISLVTFGAVTYTACNKDHCKGVTCQNGGSCNSGNCSCPSGYTGTFCEVKGASTVYFNNKGFTPITINLNGQTYTIDTGWHLTINGSYGDSLKGSASTHGAFGATVRWDTIKFQFPKTGGVNYDLNIPNNYFFLKVTNNTDTATIRKVYVNYGYTGVETLDITNIQPNHLTYYIGYYPYSDSANARLEATPDHWSYPNIGATLYPPNQNQYYNALVP